MQNKETAISSDIALYDLLKYDGIISRLNTYVPASPESGYQPNQLITFAMPQEAIDFRNSSFQFTVSASAPGSTYAYFNSDIRSIIRRMTVSFGSKIVLDIQNQNLLFNITNELKDPLWASYNGLILNGTGSQVQRQADFTNANRVYSVQLYNMNSELLSQVLPLQKLSMNMYVNIYLAAANECITTDSVNPTFTVNNCQFHYSSLVMSQTWENLWDAKIPKSIAYNYITYENAFDTSLLANGISRASKTLNYRYTSLNGIIFVMRPSANINSLTAVDKLNRYDFNNLNLCQVRIGGYTQPSDNTANLSDRLTMVCEMFGLSTKNPLAGALNFGSTSFVGAVNLARHPYSSQTNNSSINGINTSISSALILDLGFSAPLSQAYTLDIYAVAENSIVFTTNGSLVWEN